MPSTITACIFRLVAGYLLLWPTFVAGQRPQPAAPAAVKPTRFITGRDGLPQSFITGLVQDQAGFLWVGTSDGLARYDGQQFKVYRHRPGDTTSLSSNFIVSLYRDGRNRLWVANTEGIDILDPVTEQVTHLPALGRVKGLLFNARRFLVDSRDQLWLIRESGGLVRLSVTTGKMTMVSRRTHGLLNDTVRALVEDRDRQLWAFTQSGFCRLDPRSDRFEAAPSPYPIHPGTDYQTQIVGLLRRRNGEILVGDHAACLVFNPVTRAYRSVPWPRQPQSFVFLFQEGPGGEVYVEIEGAVYQYTDREGFSKVWDRQALGDDKIILTMLLDRSGMLWLGTNTGGMRGVDLQSAPFYSGPYTTGFQRDAFRQTTGFELEKLFPVLQKRFNGYSFRYAYREGNYWIGYEQAVGYYDARRNLYGLLPTPPALRKPQFCTGVALDPNGRLWTLAEKAATAYWDAGRNSWVDSLGFSLSDPNFETNDLLADRDRLWVTSSFGLLCLRLADRRAVFFNRKTHPDLFQTDRLLDLERDPQQPQVLWISSYEGLIRFDTRTQTGQVFTTREGLPSNTVYAIVADEAGYLWLSTNLGLCRFHPRTYQIRQFRSYQGLQGDEFNRFHHLKLPDGRIAFGGTEGWTLFDPRAIRTDTFEPTVVLTGLRINNVPSEYGESGSPLSAPLNSLPELILPHDQNSLSFEFASNQYNQPDKRHYRYQLVGVDPGWVDAGSFPVATYTQLRPGRYILRINAANSSERWSRHVRTLVLTIQPPFWATGWAYAIYALLLGGLGLVSYRMWSGRQRERQQMKRKEQEAEQIRIIGELKTRFFANVTHELRTPLTLILSPLDPLLKDPALPPAMRSTLQLVRRNAEHLLRLINQLLDLAKLEGSRVPVTEVRGNPVAYLRELAEAFRPLAEQNGLTFSLEAPETESEWMFDADKLEKIVYNLLGNAVKFTPAGGSIRTGLSLEAGAAGGLLRITVADTGIGIAPEHIDRIFDRFFQVEDEASATRLVSGTGIGLALTRELTDLLGGQLTVESQPGRGSTFTVVLPVKQAKAAQPALAEGAMVVSGLVDEPVQETGGAALTARLGADEGERPLVLVVDDNADLRQFISEALAGPYRVRTAINGEEGWQLVLRELPDLVVSDVMMPVLDGYALCHRIKQTPVTSHIAVLLLTARSATPSKLEGLAAGANDYLVKPFDLAELRLRVQNWLNYQRQLRAFLQKRLGEGHAPVAHQTLDDPFLRQLYEVLDTELANPDLTVEKLARSMAVSTRSLHRKLSALTNLSPIELIRSHRFRKAAEYLQAGYSVGESAYRVGMENLPYFSQSFKEFFAQTPTEYIQHHRKAVYPEEPSSSGASESLP